MIFPVMRTCLYL